jgi:hypothetical protein
MKTIKLMVAALALAAFTGCSKDDNGSQTGGDLTARWNQTKSVTKISGESYSQDYENSELDCGKDFLEFKDDGTVIRTTYSKDPDTNACMETPGSPIEYTKDGNTLVIAGGLYGGTYTIKKLTSSALTIESTNTSAGITTVTDTYFTKASS